MVSRISLFTWHLFYDASPRTPLPSAVPEPAVPERSLSLSKGLSKGRRVEGLAEVLAVPEWLLSLSKGLPKGRRGQKTPKKEKPSLGEINQ